MKITKKTFITLIINLIILPLLGNENILNTLHISLIAKLFYYILPCILAGLLIFDYVKNEKKEKINKFELVLFSIFIIVLSLSFAFSIIKAIYTISNFIKFILFIFFILIISKIDFSKKQKKIIDYSIIGLLIFTSILGIIQYIFGIDITLAGIEKYPGALGRVKSTFYIATLFDKYLLISILYSIYLLINKRINKHLNSLSFILGNIALALTFCRSSLIIILAVYFILIIYCIIKKKYIISLLIIIVLTVIYFIPGQNYLYSSTANYLKQVANTISNKTNLTFISNTSNLILNNFIIDQNIKTNNDKTDEDDKKDEDIDIQLKENFDYSIDSRNYFQKIGKYLMKSNPILGIGIGSYNFIYENQNAHNYINKNYTIDENKKYLYPHNMYVQLGAEIGIIGMILFFLIIIFILLKTKNIFASLLLLIIMLSCYSESLFYMKDTAYFTTFIISFFSNKNFLTNKKD